MDVDNLTCPFEIVVKIPHNSVFWKVGSQNIIEIGDFTGMGFTFPSSDSGDSFGKDSFNDRFFMTGAFEYFFPFRHFNVILVFTWSLTL